MTKKLKPAHVPTAAELAEEGLAKVIERNKAGKPVSFRIKPKGYAKIQAAQSINVEVVKAAELEVANLRADVERARQPLLKAERKRAKLFTTMLDL